jgi:hypothetical protein
MVNGCNSNNKQFASYSSTLAASAQIILFFLNAETFLNVLFSPKKKIAKENGEFFEIFKKILIFETEISKLIDHKC